jgi:hypothetical protein
MICAREIEQSNGLHASVMIARESHWEWINVTAIGGVGTARRRLESEGGPDEFTRLRADVRSWGLVPRIEQQTLDRLAGLEREYRDWKALRRSGRSRVNWAFVAVVLSALTFWPLAVYGAMKLLGW